MRLTEKIEPGYVMIHKSMGSQASLDMHQEKIEIIEMIQKLGPLEDIEEKWHIDLANRICFFKTLDNKIMPVNIIGLDFRDGTIVVETLQKTNIFPLRQAEYRTKWALTEEELE